MWVGQRKIAEQRKRKVLKLLHLATESLILM